MIDDKYTRDVSFPLRFDEDADLALDEDEAVIEQALQIIAFTPRGSVILTETLGSNMQLDVFEQLDEATELSIDSSLRRAFEENEPRVFLDREFQFDESPDEHKLIVIAPYTIIVTGQLAVSRFIIQRPAI